MATKIFANNPVATALADADYVLIIQGGVDKIVTGLNSRGGATATELGYLSGVTSAVQTQFNSEATARAAADTALAAPQYVTLAATATLANERVLTGTVNQVVLTDGGAGAAITLSLPQSIATTSNVQFGYFGIGTAAVSTQGGTILLGTATDKGLVVKGAASHSGNEAEFQNSSGTPYVTVGPPTLLGSSATSNWLNVTGTMPTTMTAATTGVYVVATGAGSSTQQNHALRVDYLAGYTGSGICVAGRFLNTNVTTGAFNSFLGSSGGTFGSIGVLSVVQANSTFDCGVFGSAEGTTLNIGVIGGAVTASGSGKNIGGALVGGNTGGGVEIGAYVGLRNTIPTWVSGALVVNNDVSTAAIALFQDNQTTVVTITDGGDATFAPVVRTTGSPTGITYTGAAHTTLTKAEVTDANFNFARTVNFSSGGATIAAQRSMRIQATTFTATTNAVTLTLASTLDVSGAPVASTNITITQGYAITAGARIGMLAGTSTSYAAAGGALFDHFADGASVSTDGTEDDLYTDTTAANTLATNGDKLEADYCVVVASSATATRRIKAYFGGTLILDSGTLTFTSAGTIDIWIRVIRVSSTVCRVRAEFVETGITAQPIITYTSVTGLTLSGTNIIKITGIAASTGAAGGDITAKLGSVAWCSAA